VIPSVTFCAGIPAAAAEVLALATLTTIQAKPGRRPSPAAERAEEEARNRAAIEQAMIGEPVSHAEPQARRRPPPGPRSTGTLTWNLSHAAKSIGGSHRADAGRPGGRPIAGKRTSGRPLSNPPLRLPGASGRRPLGNKTLGFIHPVLLSRTR
jgi:hypothetical protein